MNNWTIHSVVESINQSINQKNYMYNVHRVTSSSEAQR